MPIFYRLFSFLIITSIAYGLIAQQSMAYVLSPHTSVHGSQQHFQLTPEQKLVEAYVLKQNPPKPDLSKEWAALKKQLDQLYKTHQLYQQQLRDVKAGKLSMSDINLSQIDSFNTKNGQIMAIYPLLSTDKNAWQVFEILSPYSWSLHVVGYGLIQTIKDARAEGLQMMAKYYSQQGQHVLAISLLHESRMISYSKKKNRQYSYYLNSMMLTVNPPSINADKEEPEVCLYFSNRLRKKQALPLKDYFTFEQGPKDFTVIEKNRQACIKGLNFGTTYTLTIHDGLVGQDGQRLFQSVTYDIATKDRNPTITFSNNQWIIPKNGDETIPLRSINVQTVTLELYQINDRNLIPFVQESSTQNLRYYEINSIKRQWGKKIWSGSMDLEYSQNKQTTTLLPIRSILPEMKPGFYLLWASKIDDQDFSYSNHPTQMMLVTDIALTYFRGPDGLTIESRSMKSGRIIPGATVTLYAKNNSELLTATTNKKGIAKFSPAVLKGQGGDSPALITAQKDLDFTMMQYNSYSGLDLSDHQINGEHDNQSFDYNRQLYGYTERGVYRGGETVHFHGLLRNQKGKAIAGEPLEIKLIRPDGSVALSQKVNSGPYGSIELTYDLDKNARTGQWDLHTIGQNSKNNYSLASTSFSVEDFVPQRLTASLASHKDSINVGEMAKITASGRFLYGAATKGLSATLQGSLRVDPKPFKEFSAYSFGLEEDSVPNSKILDTRFTLDDQGSYTHEKIIETLPDTTRPLLLAMSLNIQDVGGRPVYARNTLKLRHQPLYLGIKGARSFEKDSQQDFTILSLDQQGKIKSGEPVLIKVIQLHYDYDWYYSEGRWRFRSTITEELIDSKSTTTAADGTIKMDFALDSGRYKLEVASDQNMTATSKSFTVGYWSNYRSANSPDILDLNLKSTAINTGESIEGKISAPFDGYASLYILSDTVEKLSDIAVVNGEASFSLPAKASYGPGYYLLVSAYRPNADQVSPLPLRSMGFQWISQDADSRKLLVNLDMPDTVMPRQKASLPVHVTTPDGKPVKGTVKLRVMAVDEGILRLTGYKSPKPFDFFNGKKYLNFTLNDLYKSVVTAVDGERGTPRSGGDEALNAPIMVTAMKATNRNQGTSIVSIRRSVALVEKSVSLDQLGNGTITLTLPDFTGKLRVMAVAWDSNRTGQTATPLIVRDPVVSDLMLPRFMAPNDQAQSVITIDNLTGKKQKLTYRLSATDGVGLSGKTSGTLTLDKDGRADIPVTITGVKPGTASFTLSVSGKAIKPTTRSWQLSVRAAAPFRTVEKTTLLNKGESLAHKPAVDDVFYADSIMNYVSLGWAPKINVRQLIDDLVIYPYYCTEQTVSKAMPLLYADQLIKSGVVSMDEARRKTTINDAIKRLSARQQRDGGLSLWPSQNSSYAWASLYAYDFLTAARDRGFAVSDTVLENLVRYAKNITATRRQNNLASQAYAHYVLARQGMANISDLRYFAANRMDFLTSRLSKAQIAAAVAHVGMKKEARDSFIKAIGDTIDYNSYGGEWHYRSIIRDNASIVALIAETGVFSTTETPSTIQLLNAFPKFPYLSTQEKAWIIRAISSLEQYFTIDMMINGKPFKKDHGHAMLNGDSSLTMINNSDKPITVIQGTSGVPKTMPKAYSDGIKLTRRFLSENGEEFDLATLKQNDSLIVVVNADISNDTQFGSILGDKEILLVDLLPAGFEVEKASIGNAPAIDFQKLKLERTPYVYMDARDDRVFAAYKVGNGRRKVTLVYRVRAITPGIYTLPGSFAENMYSPQQNAQLAATRITISKDEK